MSYPAPIRTVSKLLNLQRLPSKRAFSATEFSGNLRLSKLIFSADCYVLEGLYVYLALIHTG